MPDPVAPVLVTPSKVVWPVTDRVVATETDPGVVISEGSETVGFPETPSPLVTEIWLAVPVIALVSNVPAPVRATIPVDDNAANAVKSASSG